MSRADMHHKPALMWAGALLPDVDALPCAKREPTACDGIRQRDIGEERLDVGWHVVGTLGGVREERIALGHEAIEPRF